MNEDQQGTMSQPHYKTDVSSHTGLHDVWDEMSGMGLLVSLLLIPLHTAGKLMLDLLQYFVRLCVSDVSLTGVAMISAPPCPIDHNVISCRVVIFITLYGFPRKPRGSHPCKSKTYPIHRLSYKRL